MHASLQKRECEVLKEIVSMTLEEIVPIQQLKVWRIIWDCSFSYPFEKIGLIPFIIRSRLYVISPEHIKR